MKLAIGLLLSNGFPVPVPFMLSVLDLYARLLSGETPVRAVNLIRSEGFPVDAARNDVVRTFLASTCDALLFLDADMRHRDDLPERLLAHDVPIVTANYFMRRWPYQSTAMVPSPVLDGPGRYRSVHVGKGLQRIAVGGAGALLIRRPVLEAIREKFGDEWFRYQRDPKPPHDLTVSEDFFFYQQAARLGVAAYCDFDTISTHLAQVEIGQDMHDASVHAQAEAIEREKDPAVKAAAVRNFVVLGHPQGLTLNDGTIVPNAGPGHPGPRPLSTAERHGVPA